MSQARTAVLSDAAPDPIGPYSQAIRHGGLLFVSGQLPIDPDSGQLHAGSPAEQARRCLEHLAAISEAAGTSLEAAVKLTVYTTVLGAFAEINEAYSDFFGSTPPARAAVGVAALPKGAQVEIDAIIAVD